MDNKTLTDFLFEKIPLTKSLGIQVRLASREKVEIWAPLAPNHNHLGSAFGGSLSALLILGGYTWLYHFMESEGHRVHVILKSQKTDYMGPVESDFLVTCTPPSKEELTRFMDSFLRKGVGRIQLESKIGDLARNLGEFVVKRS